MSRQRGLALVSVLWGVAILSLVAAAMLSASVTSAHLGRNAWSTARAGSIADMAVNQAILSLLDARPPRQPRVDGMPAIRTFDGLPAQVWIQDESGKINLNVAPKELLQSLFVSAGTATDDAGALADRIVARRPAPGTPAAKLAFRTLDDLLTVPGMTRAFFSRIEPALTVYGTAGSVNQQVAPRVVLGALPDMDEDAIDRVLKARDAVHDAQAADASAMAGSPLGAAGAAFLVTAEVRAGGADVVRTAVVQFTGDATKPYLILAWR